MDFYSENCEPDFKVSEVNGQRCGLLKDNALISSVISALSVDRQLPQGVDSPRGGYWGLPNFGTRSWSLLNKPNTGETQRLLELYTREALQYLITNGVAQSVDVVVNPIDTSVNITIHEPNGTESAFTWAWNSIRVA